MTAVVTIDGVTALRGPTRWDLVYGIQPAAGTYQIHRANLDQISTQPMAVTVRIEHPSVEPTVVGRLSLVSAAPTGHPDVISVTVADERYWLGRRWHAAVYNLRKRSGVRRRLRQEGDRIEVSTIADDVTFAPWSLKGGTIAWSAASVLGDVLSSVWTGSWTQETTTSVPIESLEIDDPGDAALARILRVYGSAEVFVRLNGQMVVRDRADGSEATLSLGPPLVGPSVGTVTVSTSPVKVRVLFTREPEVRVELVEEIPSTVRNSLERRAENVAPTPDPTTLVSGVQVPTGVYRNLKALLAAWNASLEPGQTVPITLTKILETWFVPGVFEAMIQGIGLQPSAVLARRMGTIRSHLRQTFQLHTSLLDRISDWFPRRAALLDSETQTFAPSLVYADWSVWYSIRGLAREGTARTRLHDNFDGYAALLADAKVAPATVNAVDRELGVLRLDWQPDPLGDTVVVAPGKASNAGKADPRQARAGLAGILKSNATLDAGWTGATVITVRPAAPNSVDRFHAIEVDHTRASEVLKKEIPAGESPAFTIHVNPSLVTARYAWQDDEADQIERILGGDLSGASGGIALRPVNEDDLQAVAEAYAAAIYAKTKPLRVGSHTQLLDPSLEPTGSAARVSHGIEPDGTPTTTVTYSPAGPDYDFVAYLPDGVRRRVLGLVDRGASS